MQVLLDTRRCPGRTSTPRTLRGGSEAIAEPSPPDRVVPAGDFLAHRNGVLCMEGRPLSALAEQVGTPFFLISEARLVANYRALERGLSGSGMAPILRYCAKANHEAAVLETLAGCGSHLLASHAAEIELAVSCGFAPARIAYARPVLTAAELGVAIDLGVALIHVHRPADLLLLEQAAARAGRRVRASLRLRPGRGLAPLDRLSHRLGFDPDETLAAFRRCAGSPWVEVSALNFYLGTQQSHANGFARMFRGVFELLQRITAETGAVVREVNLGGGIPSPSLRAIGPGRLLARWRDRPAPAGPDGASKQEEFATRLALRYRKLARAAGLDDPPALAAEPGRSIVGDAAVMVTRVQAVDGRWAFLDASRTFLPESPLLFTRRILPLAEPAGGTGDRFYHLSGSTLNTLDVLELRRRLPALEIGDGLAFCDAGAYSISRASWYAGLPPAAYLLQADGGVRLARRAGTVADLLRPMIRSKAGTEDHP